MDDDCPAVIQNLTKAQKVWQIISRILRREGARPRVFGFFFKSVFQLVLLFGAEMWVVIPCIGRVLGGFQDKVPRRLTGSLTLWRLYGRWEYTSAEAARI